MQNPKSKEQRISLKAKNIEDRDDIFNDLHNQYPFLVELNLSDNQLTSLPNDLSLFVHLQSLDITNNPFANFELVTEALTTLPALVDLKINLTTQEEALLILNQLPNLQYLNGKSTRDETHIVDIEDKEIESISLNNEISNFNNIFTKVSEKLKSINREANREFFDEFQSILKNEITLINKSVDSTIPNYIYATHVLSSKLVIFKYFHKKYADYLELKETESSKILKEISENIFKSSDFLISIINKLYPKIDEKTETLRRQLEEALKAAQNVDKELGGYEQNFSKEREALIMQHNKEKLELQKRIDKLEQENKIMTEKLLKNAKDIINSNLGSQSNMFNNEDQLNYTRNTLGETMNNGNKTKYQGNNATIGPMNSRVLTVKMMKDIISEIYTSKVEFDKKCMENKLPRETMEQHMYTYLNQKYGLKNLIIEWATCIINGIKMYSAEDSDICLFGKILRNEIEEDARLVLQRLKTTISDLLSYFLKSKNPLKANAEIKEMVNQRVNGVLIEEEWKSIIYYVYENDDAKNLENRIIQFIKMKISKGEQISSNKKLTREELVILSRTKEEYKLDYKYFTKILQDYQIKSRDKYLKNFVRLFKKVDTDNNGILNEDEFISLLTSFKIYDNQLEDNVQRLLTIVDPYNNKQITFSECVSLFSIEFLVSEDGANKISVLDKICLDETLVS